MAEFFLAVGDDLVELKGLQAQQNSFCTTRFKRIVKQKTSKAMIPWKCVLLLRKAI